VKVRKLKRLVLKKMWRKVQLNMLGKRMAEHLWATSQRKGFMRRFLERLRPEELKQFVLEMKS
jgi:hypothetical protein